MLGYRVGGFFVVGVAIADEGAPLCARILLQVV